MGEAMHRTEPLALSRLLGFCVEVYPERKQAHCVLDASEVHVNRSGVVHGGISATLLDTASGVTASLTVDDSGLAPFTTVSLNINYIATARPGMLRAEGRLTGADGC
jgi:acyl-coenzyme A thioesterase 13